MQLINIPNLFLIGHYFLPKFKFFDLPFNLILLLLHTAPILHSTVCELKYLHCLCMLFIFLSPVVLFTWNVLPLHLRKSESSITLNFSSNVISLKKLLWSPSLIIYSSSKKWHVIYNILFSYSYSYMSYLLHWRKSFMMTLFP